MEQNIFKQLNVYPEKAPIMLIRNTKTSQVLVWQQRSKLLMKKKIMISVQIYLVLIRNAKSVWNNQKRKRVKVMKSFWSRNSLGFFYSNALQSRDTERLSDESGKRLGKGYAEENFETFQTQFVQSRMILQLLLKKSFL